MTVHTVVEKTGIYSITFTCHDWLPLIALSDCYGTVYHFFEVLKQRGHTVTGYVIMPWATCIFCCTNPAGRKTSIPSSATANGLWPMSC